FLWLGLVGTAIAYVCWFHGLARMPAGAASLVGLLNPVVGTLLGVAFAGEVFGWAQALGMALVLGGVLAGQGWGAKMTGWIGWIGSGAARLRPSSPPSLSRCPSPAAATPETTGTPRIAA